MADPTWNFEQEPYDEPPDESSRSLRSHLDRMPDGKMQQYRSEWTDEQVMEWDGNFRDDGNLMLVCCEREIDAAEYRRELEACIRYRDRFKAAER
jgi:hypothetical protein